jgi:hypothetical protein
MELKEVKPGGWAVYGAVNPLHGVERRKRIVIPTTCPEEKGKNPLHGVER